jgi:hypothetical protein
MQVSYEDDRSSAQDSMAPLLCNAFRTSKAVQGPPWWMQVKNSDKREALLSTAWRLCCSVLAMPPAKAALLRLLFYGDCR